MNLADLANLLLNLTIIVGLTLDIPVTYIVVRAAVQKPRFWSLLLMAYVCLGIGAVVLVSYWGATNAATGYPVTREVVQVTFRLVLLFLAAFPPLFLWVYRTGRFRDGGA